MTNANDMAFPVLECADGLTKREYFAAMAMQGFIASYAGAGADPTSSLVADRAIEYADALINALNHNPCHTKP